MPWLSRATNTIASKSFYSRSRKLLITLECGCFASPMTLRMRIRNLMILTALGLLAMKLSQSLIDTF